MNNPVNARPTELLEIPLAGGYRFVPHKGGVYMRLTSPFGERFGLWPIAEAKEFACALATRPQAPAPTQRGEVLTTRDQLCEYLGADKAIATKEAAHLQPSVQPSRSAVEAAEACRLEVGKHYIIEYNYMAAEIQKTQCLAALSTIIQQYGENCKLEVLSKAHDLAEQKIATTVRPNDGLQAMLDKMFESGNQLYYNSANSIAEEWREKQKGTAGWSHQAVMARVYFELMDFVRAYQAALTPATSTEGAK